MKKLKLIYNPHAGNGGFRYDLDPCTHIFQTAGYETHIYRSMERGDIGRHLGELDIGYDAIVVSGGDGTINAAIESMLANRLDIPLGIIPSGTANDFASYLKLPPDSDKAALVIANGRTISTDVGRVNDRHFINVCSAGLFTSVSQSVDGTFKGILGKLAYYIKGLEQLPSFKPMRARITNSNETIDESLYLFLILNSAGAGGFPNLSPEAKIDDGFLDFIGIREMPLIDLAALFIKVLRGEHLGDPNIIFFRDSAIRIDHINQINQLEDVQFGDTDIDGERGPNMPIDVSILKKAIQIFVPD